MIQIKKLNDGGLVLDDGEVSLSINNVNLASNGATFNIPDQEINNKSSGLALSGNVVGLNEFALGESRCDGVYDDKLQNLSFSYQGLIKIEKEGESYSVPISVTYDQMSKLK